MLALAGDCIGELSVRILYSGNYYNITYCLLCWLHHYILLLVRLTGKWTGNELTLQTTLQTTLMSNEWIQTLVPTENFPLDGILVSTLYSLHSTVYSLHSTVPHWDGNQERSVTSLHSTRPSYLGTVESIVQFVRQLLLLLPGCLHQAGVHEGERLHDLLHGKPRPGGLLLGLGWAEHLIKKKVKYPAVSPPSSLQFVSWVAATTIFNSTINQRKSFLCIISQINYCFSHCKPNWYSQPRRREK